MPQAHFLEVKTISGEWALVRADRIDAIQPHEDGLLLHTPSQAIIAVGATRVTLEEDLKSAQIILVGLNRSTGFAPQKAAPAPVGAESAPVREPIVRAPPPVSVPGVTDVDETPTQEEEVAEAAAPAPKKVSRKTSA